MKEGRHKFLHDNKVVYEWQQSLESLSVFIQCPAVPEHIKKSSLFDIKITSSRLTVGIKGNPPYLSHEFKSIADSEESLWYIDEKKQTKRSEIVVEIQKAQKGVRWGCVFKGHQNLDPVEEQELKKKLMLERFQEENPGFDFTDAQFNGQVPDARTFMGGVK